MDTSRMKAAELDIPVLEALPNEADELDLNHLSRVPTDLNIDNDDDESEDEDGGGDYVAVLQTREDAKFFDAQLQSRRRNRNDKKKGEDENVFSQRSFPSRSVSVGVEQNSNWRIAMLHNNPVNSSSRRTYSAEGFGRSDSTDSSIGTLAPNLTSMITKDSNGGTIERELIRSGWLIKQSKHLKAWKRRFFVLIKRTNTGTGEYTASLQYYKGMSFKKLRGEINLRSNVTDEPVSIRFVDFMEVKQRAFCFEISSRSQDIYMICQAANDIDASAWVCNLQILAHGSIQSVGEPFSFNHSSVFFKPNLGNSIIGMSNVFRQSSLLQNGISSMDLRDICMVAELRRLFYGVDSPETIRCREFVKRFESSLNSSTPQSVSQLLRSLNAFLVSMGSQLMEQHGHRIHQMLKSVSNIQQHEVQTYNTDDMSLEVIGIAISRTIEEVVVSPLSETIQRTLVHHFHDDESTLHRKLRWLQGKDQTYFSIPMHQISLKEWRDASKILSRVAHVSLISDKMEVLIRTIDEIQFSFAEEHQHLTDLEGLEMDDVIPIFTFVLATSGLENLMSLRILLTSYTNANQSLPDSFFAALSIFHHAVDFISSVSIPAVLEDIFKEQVTLSMDGNWRRILELEMEPTYGFGAIVSSITPHGVSAIGNTLSRGHILVTVNGQNVVLWPFQAIQALMVQHTRDAGATSHRLAFIPGSSYFKILNSTKSLWNVALMHACQRGDIVSVQMLLSHGADVNYQAVETNMNRPLHVATSCRHFAIVSYLLAHGAKVNATGEFGRTALHMLGRPCTLPSSFTPLNFLESQDGNEETVVNIVRKLVTYYAQVDVTDIFGNTVVMLLGASGHLAGIDALMESANSRDEVDFQAKNWQDGHSALTLAAREGQDMVVDSLLAYGAFVDERTLDGKTALHYAVSIASKRIANSLLEAGADVNARTAAGITPLMLAVSVSFRRSQHSITRLSGTFEARDRTGSTCRIHDEKKERSASNATIDGSMLPFTVHVDEASVLETINVMLEKGASLTAVCNLYRSPLHYAAMYGGRMIYNYLWQQYQQRIERVSMYSKRDLHGETVLSMLQDGGNSSEIGEQSPMIVAAPMTPPMLTNTNETPPPSPHVASDSSNTMKIPSRTSSKNLLIEDSGPFDNVTIIGGSIDAILQALLQTTNFQVQAIDAIIWSREWVSKTPFFQKLLSYLKAQVLSCTNNYAKSPSNSIFYVRRMALHVINTLVDCERHCVQLNRQVYSDIQEVCELIVGPEALDNDTDEDDIACAQWLKYSLLPSFMNACRSESGIQSFHSNLDCEDTYASIQTYLDATIISQERNGNSSLKFLTQDSYLVESTNILSEKLRRRLLIAGVGDPTSNTPSLLNHQRNDHSQLSDKHTYAKKEIFIGNLESSVPAGPHIARNVNVYSSRSRLWLLDAEPHAVALQLAHFQHYLFSRVKMSEFLAPKKTVDIAPAYTRLKDFHNHVSLLVVSTILSQDSPVERAQVLMQFIRVAQACLTPLQNFDGFMAIMNATNDSSVFRLKRTWGRLSTDTRDIWHDLKRYTEAGARSLNKLLKDAHPPVIPYFGVMMQNLLALQEYPDILEGGLLNFKKMQLIGNLVQRMVEFQKSPYLIDVDHDILDHICFPPRFSDADACFKRSLIMEPRVAKMNR